MGKGRIRNDIGLGVARLGVVATICVWLAGPSYAWQVNVSDINPAEMLEVVREEPIVARFAKDFAMPNSGSPTQPVDGDMVRLNAADGSSGVGLEAFDQSERDEFPPEDSFRPLRSSSSPRVAVQTSSRLNQAQAESPEASQSMATTGRAVEVWHGGRRMNAAAPAVPSPVFQPAPIWYGRLPKSAASKNGVRERPIVAEPSPEPAPEPAPPVAPAGSGPQTRLSAPPTASTRNALLPSTIFPARNQAISEPSLSGGERLSKSDLDRAIELAEARKAGRDLTSLTKSPEPPVKEEPSERAANAWSAPLPFISQSGQDPSPLAYFTVALAFTGPLMLVFCLVLYLVATMRSSQASTVRTETRESCWANSAPNVVMQPTWPPMMAPQWGPYAAPSWGVPGYAPMTTPVPAPAPAPTPAPAPAAAPAASIAIAPHTTEIEPSQPAIVETRVSESPRRAVTPRRSGTAAPAATVEQGMIRGIFEDNLKIRTGSKGKSGPNAA